jgi:hypothetical protein
MSAVMKLSLIINSAIVVAASVLFWCFLQLIDVSGHKDFYDTLPQGVQILSFYLTPFFMLAYFRWSFVQNRVLTVLDLACISIAGSFISTIYTIIQNLIDDWGYVRYHENQLYRRHFEPQITFFLIDVILFFVLAAGIMLVVTIPLKIANTKLSAPE